MTTSESENLLMAAGDALIANERVENLKSQIIAAKSVRLALRGMSG